MRKINISIFILISLLSWIIFNPLAAMKEENEVINSLPKKLNISPKEAKIASWELFYNVLIEANENYRKQLIITREGITDFIRYLKKNKEQLLIDTCPLRENLKKSQDILMKFYEKKDHSTIEKSITDVTKCLELLQEKKDEEVDKKIKNFYAFVIKLKNALDPMTLKETNNSLPLGDGLKCGKCDSHKTQITKVKGEAIQYCLKCEYEEFMNGGKTFAENNPENPLSIYNQQNPKGSIDLPQESKPMPQNSEENNNLLFSKKSSLYDLTEKKNISIILTREQKENILSIDINSKKEQKENVKLRYDNKRGLYAFKYEIYEIKTVGEEQKNNYVQKFINHVEKNKNSYTTGLIWAPLAVFSAPLALLGSAGYLIYKCCKKNQAAAKFDLNPNGLLPHPHLRTQLSTNNSIASEMEKSKIPFHQHGSLLIQNTKDSSIIYLASGTLIDKSHILTTLESIYNQETKKCSPRITFYPFAQKKGVSEKGYPIEKTAFFPNSNHSQKNLAILKLKEPIETYSNINNIDEYLLRGVSYSEKNIKKVTLIGFPGKKPYRGLPHSLTVDVNSIIGNEFFYNVESLGQSGAGIWTEIKGNPYFLGIYNEAEGGKSSTFINIKFVKELKDFLDK